MIPAKKPMNIAERHRRWLELVDTDGPFVAVPALNEVWPQGMPQLSAWARASLGDAKTLFEHAWDRWDKNPTDPGALEALRKARNAWAQVVLRDVAGWDDFLRIDLAATPAASARATSPHGMVAIAPEWALTRDDRVGALVFLAEPCDSLHDVVDDGWAASPIDRAETVLRASGVPLGIVTDGRWWALVCAQKGTMVASGVVDSQRWIEEPDVRDGYFALVSRQQLIGGALEKRTPQLFLDSVAAAEDITEALGTQVRRAVELLVSAFSEAAEEALRHGAPNPLPADRALVYEGAVTAMMRVVFLLFAEERSLLPQGQLFTMGYGISGELDDLDARAREAGTEALDGTHLTWHRLLATSQALYGGALFEDMRLPSYGGSLFDGSRYPFLTARDDRGVLSVTVSDRVMLEVLRAVQVAQLKGQPARRISFRSVDVEQIGYIYEGLLGYSCQDVHEVTVGLIGKSGLEPEITLARLEELDEGCQDDASFVAAVLVEVKLTQPGATLASKAAMIKALRTVDQIEDADRALLAVTRDEELLKRLKPYVGLIRRDLRDRPTVIQAGGLVVIETPSRATSGAHYTPRSLAREVVQHALEPLVYRPGPHQTPDTAQWQPITSDEILDLKVADIACGSGAFLVAAAEFLGERLLEAWHREGVAHGTAHEIKTRAVRQVVASCLYGADINGMAVEMCKLSLWLVSLDPKLAFSFVDDKVMHGNSLLGLTDLTQLEALHIRPSQSGADELFAFNADAGWAERLDFDAVMTRAVSLRQRLASEIDDDDPQRSATSKRRQWTEYQRLTAQLMKVADGIIAAGLSMGGKKSRALDDAYANLRIAVGRAFPSHGEGDATMLDGIIARGLTPTVATDYARWKPLHWVLAVPDVMANGGFDAIIGNPPFLGGKKVSPAMGTDVREWCVNVIAGGVKGNADLVAYFFLRAFELLDNNGKLGLIATNTVAQGDTREVGLDQMVASDFEITRAIKSRSWPVKSVNLEYSAVWGSFGSAVDNPERILDDIAVAKISSLLDPTGRVEGNPARLEENVGIAFIGSIVLGMGFVVPADTAMQWIQLDPKNAQVLKPYLNGADINSSPTGEAERWVIDFGERSEIEARGFELPWQCAETLVKPERAQKSVTKYPRMVNEWWKFWNPRPGLNRAARDLNSLLAITRVSDVGIPMRLPRGPVYSDRLVIFASEDFGLQAILSSSVHFIWLVNYGTTHESRLTYGPTAVFETFPRPTSSDRLVESGKGVESIRQDIMRRRSLGLTRLYNLVNDSSVADDLDPDVARLRDIHVELDHAVMASYGWGDVPLDHGFHQYRQMERWTVSPAARVEILDRLLEENHRRAARQGEIAQVTEDGEGEE